MKFKRCAAAVSAGAMLFLPAVALAQNVLNNPIVPPNCQGARAAWECGLCDLVQLAQNILNAGVYIMVALAAVMFAWAGFQSLTASGNTEKHAASRRVFGNVVIGLIILLVSWVAVDTLMKAFVKQDGKFGPWNQICFRTGGSAAP